MKTQRIRLFIAEDHVLLLNSYQTYLAGVEDMTVVATAANYQDFIHKVKLYTCDLLLLDLTMPVSSGSQQPYLLGLDILEVIKKEGLSFRTLVISSHRDFEIIKKAVALGAKGYVSKNIDFPELTEAIRSIANGKTYFPKDIQMILGAKQEKEDRMGAEGIRISTREKEVLRLLSEGLNAEEIAQTLGLVRYTIEEYRTNLIRKFHAKNTVNLVKLACEYKFI